MLAKRTIARTAASYKAVGASHARDNLHMLECC
jgi:hypothetical protein